ncbi:DUF2637 domain-containing protein [Streptomyces sp. NPDC001339]|uniref:DUF2637 domain-containing protein n=1 Tax=Streptomyces sp. NPDC001339 TaxID=3364563 RepID=UPI00368C0325
MSHPQGMASGPPVTTAALNPIDWSGTADRIVTDTPAWALAVTAGAVLITVLVVGFLTLSRASKRRAAREQHHREALELARKEGKPLPPEPLHMDPKPLLGGIAVSLYGLWGFATGTLDLPIIFAVGFVSMFDILELRLFSTMYKTADPSRGWTPQLRLMRATAWGFVTASAIANIVHAPNVWAAPFMAAMPVGAAWVIELPLKSALAGAEPEEEKKRPEGTKPGPFRLLALLWRRLWAFFFRKASLDVNDRADEMVRRARARDAADASYELRKALKKKDQLEEALGGAAVPRGRGKASPEQKALDALNTALENKIRPKAQTALELAETQDPEQGLQLMQRMAWLTRADDVALLDYGPDSTAMELLEQLNIAANADFIKSAKRAKDAEGRAAEAEQARKDAEAAVEEAQAKLAELAERMEGSREEAEKTAAAVSAEIEAEQRKLTGLREERQRLESSEASAGQLYQRTSKELEEIRGQLTDAQEQAREAREQLVRMEGEQHTLTERLQDLADERDKLAQAASDAGEKAREERDKALRLEERLAALEALQGAGVPAKTSKPPRIDARINGGARGAAGETRQRIRELLESMDPQERERAAATSRRELARVLIATFSLDLGEDAVRGHLKNIEEEDALQQSEGGGDVPAPRSEDDQADANEHARATA